MSILTITGITSEFAGIARDRDGKAVFVPGALPGETVEAQRVKEEKRFALGQLVSVLEPSPHRRPPACPYADSCGGCDAMHMEYGFSLECKRTVVSDAIKRIGGIADAQAGEVYSCGDPFRTRNKAEYAVSPDGRSCGMQKKASRDVIDISDCLQQKEQSVRVLRAYPRDGGALCGVVTRVSASGETMAILTGRDRREADRVLPQILERGGRIDSAWFCRLTDRPHHALDGICEHMYGGETISETVDGIRFRVSPRSFFQVNLSVAEHLYARAVDWAVEKGGPVYDLYCGTGTMTLMAARRAQAVGIEIVPEAVEDAKRASRENGIPAEFLCADAAQAALDLPKGSSVILDPPRRGADQKLLNAIVQSGVGRISYVSCDPGTLARDMKILTQGGFSVEYVEPADMFPWTRHIETCVLMSRDT